MPYVPIKGSSNSPILGGKYVKIIKQINRRKSIIKDVLLSRSATLASHQGLFDGYLSNRTRQLQDFT